MKQHLPKDELEQFLQGAFEDYSENPSDGLWSKIDGDLSGGAGLSAGAKTIIMKKWWMVAAAAVFGGIVICQQLYFQDQLNEVASELNEKNIELQDAYSKLEKKLEVKDAELAGHVKNGEQTKTKQPKVKEPNYNNSQNIAIDQKPILNQLPGAKGNVDEKEIINDEHKIPSEEIVNSSKPKQINSPQKDFEIPEPFIPQAMPMLSIEETNSESANTTVLVVSKPIETRIEPIATGNWYGGFNTMFSKTFENISRVENKNPPNQNPPGGPRKCFNDQNFKTTGQQRLTGLTVGYQSKGNWGFQSGIMLKKTNFSNRHRAKFKFKDRDHNNNNPNEHDFVYNLNTAGGQAELEIRAEQTNASEQISPNEDIDFDIETEQVFEYWSIPLLATYRIKKGQVGLKFKSGVMANGLKSKEFDIIDVKVKNHKFKLRNNHSAFGHQRQTRSLSFDLVASIGVDYYFNDNINLSIEPTIMVSPKGRHESNDIKSSSYATGLNAALTYYF